MATFLKVVKDKQVTPEYIRDMLFYFHDVAHKFHQQTKDGWEHKGLAKLYETLHNLKDEIPEELMGYLGGKRLGGLEIIELPDYKEKNDSINLCNSIIEFAYSVYEWAGKNKYCDIENKSQELSGVAARTIYRLTLN